MKQYQRTSESEKARMLIEENHQEKFENNLEREIEDLVYYFSHERYEDLSSVDESYLSWPREIFSSREDYSKFVVNKVERVMKEMRKEYGDELFDDYWDKFDDENLGENYEGYFPKHLEYDMDRFGYPIIESGKKENKNDWFYEEVKVQENLEKEEYDNLIKMLRRRHHLSPTKRIVF